MADFEQLITKHSDEDGNIPKSAIAAVVTAIRQAVGNEYVEKERYKAKLSEIDSMKEQMQTADDKATTAEKWKTKYEDLKKEFTEFQEKQKQKESRAAAEKEFSDLLKDMKVSERGIEKILKYNMDGVELDADGKLKNASELKKTVSEEWAEYIETVKTEGASTPKPPENNGGGKLTKDDIFAIKDTTERQKAIAENHELFGF